VTIPPWLGSVVFGAADRLRKYQQARRRVSVLVHEGVFGPGYGATALTMSLDNTSVPVTGTGGTPEDSRYYFVKVTNRRDRPIEITHAWFTSAPRDLLMTFPPRPLPIRLAPDATWEGWVNAASLPGTPEEVARSGRVRIAGKKRLVKSRPNGDVPEVGRVARS
jgi:hypothetical protein